MAGGALRPPQPAALRAGRLHRCLRPVRHCNGHRRTGGLSRAAGGDRRGVHSAVAGDPARHQSAEGSRPRHVDLGHGRRAGPDHRAGARRLSHRQSQLALGVLHQHPDRHRRLSHHGGDAAQARQAQPAEVRRLRLHRPGRRPHRHADGARPRAEPGVVLLSRDLDLCRHRRAGRLHLLRPHLHHRAADHPPVDPGRPQLPAAPR